MPEVKLTNKESEDYFYNALCNDGGYVRSSGCSIDWNETDYKKAKLRLKKAKHESICIEDVLVEILRMGKTLTWVDEEGEGYYTRVITLKDVHRRVKKTPIKHLSDMMNGLDDADTANVILQQVFLNDIVFG